MLNYQMGVLIDELLIRNTKAMHCDHDRGRRRRGRGREGGAGDGAAGAGGVRGSRVLLNASFMVKRAK